MNGGGGGGGIQIKKGSRRSSGIAWWSVNMQRVFIFFRLDYIVTLTSFPFLTKKKPWPTFHHVTGVWESCDITARPSLTSATKGPDWERMSDRRFLQRAEPTHLTLNWYQMFDRGQFKIQVSNSHLIMQFFAAVDGLKVLKHNAFLCKSLSRNGRHLGFLKKLHSSDFLQHQLKVIN